ncbi:hypothetical protein OIU77_015236 [Salix suchowensis]|uniref:DRBM domain-containing protein n=1 Tax=Salix suchowensis TaxID=1278906 RepID=A0ABQ8ZS63_9ROSI|nr:hypothetical protein OIU77_015236 [Salix suchowensis]
MEKGFALKHNGFETIYIQTVLETVFCKSILNEFAVKVNREKPTYNSVQLPGPLPVFTSTLVFDGVSYTGDTGRSKKEAEQLAARTVILSLLGNSWSTKTLYKIIQSKSKLHAALDRVKDNKGIL